MSGGFGSGTNVFGNTAPGTVDPFSLGMLGSNTADAITAMQNRYNQLGMGGSTPEQMDVGTLPSLVGGIPGMSQATLGQMQNNALNPSGAANTSKSSLSSLGSLGSLFGKVAG